MNAYASPGEGFARCIEDVVERVEGEVRHAVAYVDAVIVPEFRKESSAAMRLLAGHLERWADSLHRSVQS
jgi:hypothetical protein